MSVDYEFKCPKCEKYTSTHSSARHYPKIGDSLRCMKCLDSFEINFIILRCEVKKEQTK